MKTDRTAIILSGQMRTFNVCYHTQAWHVFRHFPNADFYVSTVRDDDTESWKLLHKLPAPARVFDADVVDGQPVLPEPPEPVRFEPYVRSVPVQAVLRQLWQLERAWKYMLERRGDTKYSRVIRIRPDSFFHSARFDHIIDDTEAMTPWWGRFGGVNDRFAVMGFAAAQAYFTTYSRIPHLMERGCPLHPESLVYGSLTEAGCTVDDTLRAEFSTLKRTPDGRFDSREPEIGYIDMAHASLG